MHDEKVLCVSCPFCGSDDIDLLAYARDLESRAYIVFCYNCKAKGPEEADGEDAIMAWNTRLYPVIKIEQ